MKDYIIEKVKNYILVYCLIDDTSKKVFKKDNFYLTIQKTKIYPNFINPIYFEQYYFIFKGFVEGKNIITDGYFQLVDNKLDFVSTFEVNDLKKLLPYLHENEINIIYKDNFNASTCTFISKEEKVRSLLEKEKIFQTEYVKFGMRI